MPPSPPTRVGSTRTCCRSATAAWRLGRRDRIAGGLRRGSDDELDLDAVAHDPGQRLADQRAVAGLEPVLGEPIRDGDPEALLVDIDQLRIAQPRLEIRRRQRHLELSERRSPDLLGIHSSMGSCVVMIGRWVASATDGIRQGSRASRMLPLLAPVRDGPEDPDRVFGGSPNVSGAEGPERIAPAGGAPQGDSAIPPGSIATRRRRNCRPVPGQPGDTRPTALAARPVGEV